MHAPGSRLFVEVGLRERDDRHDSDRTLALELLDLDGHVIARDGSLLGNLRGDRPVAISVQLPDDSPARYVERLEIVRPDGPPRVFEWAVEVPVQRIAAELSLSVAVAVPGSTLDLTVHNIGSTELFFGEEYQLQRREAIWIDVDLGDPDDDVEWGWPLVGHTVAPGCTWSQVADVPRHARPGRHRFVKTIGGVAVCDAELGPSVAFDVIATLDSGRAS